MVGRGCLRNAGRLTNRIPPYLNPIDVAIEPRKTAPASRSEQSYDRALSFLHLRWCRTFRELGVTRRQKVAVRKLSGRADIALDKLL